MNQPRIGVGVIVCDGKRVLLGRRYGSHGAETWCFPGGHLEFGESPADCAERELLEETGLVASDLQMGPFTNDIFENENKHYVTLFVIATYSGGIAEIREPDKCKEWGWFEWDKLPKPLFLPIQNLIEQGFKIHDKGITMKGTTRPKR
jgi:8-oxo-dGTP diphosphatase